MKQRAHLSFLAIINIATIIFTTTTLCQDPIHTVKEELENLAEEHRRNTEGQDTIDLALVSNNSRNRLFNATRSCNDTETSNALYHAARRLAFHLAHSPEENPRRQEAQTEYDKAITQFGKCIEPPSRFKI